MIVLSLIIFIINYHNNYFIFSSINSFTLYENNPSFYRLQLILLTISNPAIACSKLIHKSSNFGHELILSPIAASMLNSFLSKILKCIHILSYCILGQFALARCLTASLLIWHVAIVCNISTQFNPRYRQNIHFG